MSKEEIKKNELKSRLDNYIDVQLEKAIKYISDLNKKQYDKKLDEFEKNREKDNYDKKIEDIKKKLEDKK